MRHSTVSSHRSWLVLMAVAGLLLTTLACGFEGGAFGSTPTPRSAGPVSWLRRRLSNAAPSGSSTSTMTPGPAEGDLLITAPQPGQGVRGSLHIEGLSDPAFEQQLYVLVRDAQGTVIAAARPAIQAPAADNAAPLAPR